jgi:hypothetical protein
MRAVAPRDQAESFAARVYQWHAALAPYAGVAVTFLLALFAGLVYWSNFGRPADPAAEMAAPPTWQADAVAAPAAPSQWAAQPSFDLPESPLLQTPDVRLDLPPLEAPAETIEAPADENAHADAEPPVAPLADDAKPSDQPPTTDLAGAVRREGEAPAEPAAAKEFAALGSQEAPLSGETLRITYPTTPFASFDFGPAAAPPTAPSDAHSPAAR